MCKYHYCYYINEYWERLLWVTSLCLLFLERPMKAIQITLSFVVDVIINNNYIRRIVHIAYYFNANVLEFN